MTTKSRNKIRFAAVGDLLLTAMPGDRAARGLEALSGDLRQLFASCDVVFANLECTLPGSASVATEPIVVSTEEQIRSLKDAGVNIVTLGNNHAFDCLDEGFRKVSGILDDIGIAWCGAGSALQEASRPAIVEKNGVSVAFLGVVDETSGPHFFAEESSGGVAPFDVEGLCQSIKRLKKNVDHVVITPHWGMERFRMPSPEQIGQARSLIDAGASMILGHHPHVLQGVETYHQAPIAYSLGNFLANDVYWSDGDHLTWNRFERTGLMLVGELSADRILNIEQIPVYDNGSSVSIDKSGRGDRYLCKANNLLKKGVTTQDYNREKFYVQVVKPVVGQLKWNKLKKIRPGHLGKLIRLLSQ